MPHAVVRHPAVAARARLAAIKIACTPDLSRDVMLLIGFLVGVVHALGGVITPIDAVFYWRAGTSTELYPADWSAFHVGHLFYPPPLTQLSTLLQPIGWPVFVTALTTATFGAFWFCARKWSLPLVCIGIPHFLDIGPEAPATFLSYALLGNIQWILAALTVVAMRQPGLYPLLILTKVTSGIGLLWPLFKRDRSAICVGVLATICVTLVSFVAAPGLWLDFLGFVGRNALMADPPLPIFPIPFGMRLAGAVVLIAWGSRSNHPWTVPIAAGMSLPVVWGLGFLPFFVAATRLVDIEHIRERWVASDLGRWPKTRKVPRPSPRF